MFYLKYRLPSGEEKELTFNTSNALEFFLIAASGYIVVIEKGER